MRWLPPVLYRSRGKFFDKFPRGKHLAVAFGGDL